MAITRRQFLKRTGLAAGGMFGASVFSSPLVRHAFANLGDRYMVVIYLEGGNDGLNTVTPAGVATPGSLRETYEAARLPGVGGLQLSGAGPGGDLAGTLIANDPNTGELLGIHPGFGGNLHALYQLGKVAVIQGCGYPDYSLSHDESRQIWQRADPPRLYLDGTGWVGRHLAGEYTNTTVVPAVSISDRVTGEFVNSGASVLAIRSVLDFDFPFDDVSGSDIAKKAQAYQDIHQAAVDSGQATLGYIGSGGLDTYQVSQNYPALDGFWQSGRPAGIKAGYNIDRSLANDLREVSKIIYGVNSGTFPAVTARFFQVSNGGYDTHADQGANVVNGQHFTLHQEVGQSVQAFYNDLVDMGIADKVLIVVYSEFSRRIQQNENGTDHGSQGPMFVIGGGVTGGVYGNHANIADVDDEGNTKYSQDGGNGFRSTDFRDVYGTIMKHWLQMSDTEIIDPITPANGALRLDTGDPLLYWTSAELNMPFLP